MKGARLPFKESGGESPIRKRISTRTSIFPARLTIKPTISGLSQVWQRGQGVVEYAFILALVALVITVMLITTGRQVWNMYSDITYTLHNDAGL